MKHKDTQNKINQPKMINSNNKLGNIKNNFILKKLLETIKYNKSIQKRINININHYKEYSEKYSSIEIEVKPMKNIYGTFISIEEKDEEYYHIYYNDNG